MDSSLDDFGPSIQSKIEALKTGVVNLPELEAIYKDAKQILLKYENELDKCSRFAELCPDLPISHHRAKYGKLVDSLHTAMIEARIKLQNQRASTGRKHQLVRQRTIASDNPAASLAQEISDTLRNMSATLRDEVLRSEASFDILQRSSKRMKATSEIYISFGGIVGTTKRFIANLWRRERTDRWMIFMVLGLFYTVLFYIATQRLWLGKFVFPILKFVYSAIWGVVSWICSLFWIKSGEPLTFSPTTNLTESNIMSYTSNNQHSSILTNNNTQEVDEALPNRNTSTDGLFSTDMGIPPP